MVYGAGVPFNVAVTIAVVLGIGWLLYVIFNLRSGRREAGAEMELAPNRKPYYDDEALEGKILERTQLLGLLTLVIVVISLPAVWLLEPTRQARAVTSYDRRFAAWGKRDFDTTGTGGFNCAGCHGGLKAGGGNAPYTVTDPRTGEVKAVNWTAPALNTVLYRFSEAEVIFILTYGRPYSPMSPWGVAGGGPMDTQQLTNLVAYIKSITIPQDGCTTADPLCKGTDGKLPAATSDAIEARAEQLVAAGTYKSIGEALFNLDLNSGAYSCARCHTKGWSYGDPQASGGGALGPNLTNGDTVRQFPLESDHAAFICSGSELGKKYGQQGQGSGRMPAFCGLLTNAQIQAIVQYERGL
jgi:mono/diheme cytochrome c family protein